MMSMFLVPAFIIAGMAWSDQYTNAKPKRPMFYAINYVVFVVLFYFIIGRSVEAGEVTQEYRVPSLDYNTEFAEFHKKHDEAAVHKYKDYTEQCDRDYFMSIYDQAKKLPTFAARRKFCQDAGDVERRLSSQKFEESRQYCGLIKIPSKQSAAYAAFSNVLAGLQETDRGSLLILTLCATMAHYAIDLCERYYAMDTLLRQSSTHMFRAEVCDAVKAFFGNDY